MTPKYLLFFILVQCANKFYGPTWAGAGRLDTLQIMGNFSKKKIEKFPKNIRNIQLKLYISTGADFL